MDTLFNLGVALSKGLRDEDKDIVKCLSHTNDPETSKEAAVKMVKSGALSREEKEVLNAIKLHLSWRKQFDESEDFTAKEVHYYRGLNYYKIQRRLSGLRNKGKIERTGDKRDGCCVWRLL